jgi:hypothetical protein
MGKLSSPDGWSLISLAVQTLTQNDYGDATWRLRRRDLQWFAIDVDIPRPIVHELVILPDVPPTFSLGDNEKYLKFNWDIWWNNADWELFNRYNWSKICELLQLVGLLGYSIFVLVNTYHSTDQSSKSMDLAQKYTREWEFVCYY